MAFIGTIAAGVLGAGATAAAMNKAGDVPTIPTMGPAGTLQQGRLAFIAANFPELLEQFRIGEGDARRQGLRRQIDTVKFGKHLYRIPSSEEMAGISQRLEEQTLAQVEATQRRLASSPVFRDIFARARGDFGAFEGTIDAALATPREAALAAAYGTGNFSNPAVRSRALAPFALQKATLLDSLREQARGQTLALSGVPAAQTLSNPAFSAPGAQNFVQAGNAFARQGQLANAQFQQASTGFQASLLGGLGSSLFGAAGMMFPQPTPPNPGMMGPPAPQYHYPGTKVGAPIGTTS